MGTKFCDDLFRQVFSELKHGRNFMPQVFNLDSLMAFNDMVVLGEQFIQITPKKASNAMKSWSVIVSGFEGGTNVEEDSKFPHKILSSNILQAVIWDMDTVILHKPLGKSGRKNSSDDIFAASFILELTDSCRNKAVMRKFKPFGFCRCGFQRDCS